MEESYARLEQRRNAIIKKISLLGPWIMATPVEQKVRCGNKRCKCAAGGDARHEALYLSWTEAGNKSGTLYVPKGLRMEVLAWVENYWLVKELMKDMTELSRQMIRGWARAQRVGGKKKPRVKRRGNSSGHCVKP